MIQLGEFLGRLLGPLLKTGLPLLKSVIKPLDMLGLTSAASATDTAINKKNVRIRRKSHNTNNFK